MKKISNIYLYVVLGLFLISIILSFTSLSLLQSLRISFGGVFVLFLPGYVITELYLKERDVIEKITLSFALSIAIVPLTVFYLNKIGMRINTLNSFLSILGIIVAAFLIKIFWKTKRKE